jgi:hypothetical protein
MNTRKTIYDKLFTEKVELAKHEVELGLIEDFTKLKNNALDESMFILNDYKDVKTRATELGILIKKYVNTTIDLSNKADELSLKFKELGLDFTKDKNFAELRKAFSKQKEILDIGTKIKSL